VTDKTTGLMWEKKTPVGSGGLHDAGNLYTWRSSGTLPDGTLYTDFLANLNLDSTQSSPPKTCFANHCDWRIPNIVELQSILASPCSASSACIDAIFGPTQASFNWSSTSLLGDPDKAWILFMSNGFLTVRDKFTVNYARAVRGGR
jgi:hypothetical protein